MHNSKLNYMHMLRCIQIGWKIKYVSFSACLGPMQEMGMNFKHQGTVDCRQNIEIHGFKILVNQNSAKIHETWHDIMNDIDMPR